MSLQAVAPEAARRMLAQGAWLIDIREPDEHARERLAGAISVPMARLDALPWGEAPAVVVFHCRSGNRTRLNAQALAARLPAGCAGHVLEGGLDGWKAAGLPVQRDGRQPLELQRQVQLGAGGLALLGAVLGAMVSPWWHLLSAFVGCGLIVAGATGFCGLARLLLRAPWNRRALGR